MAIVIGLLIFGGISQKGVIEFCAEWSHNVQAKFAEWADGAVVVNDDGIYLDPTGNSSTSGGQEGSENSSP